MSINTYRGGSYAAQQRAERATMVRSLKAAARGECSQYELRAGGSADPMAPPYCGGFVGGLSGELAASPVWSQWRIVAQWSAGYRVERGAA